MGLVQNNVLQQISSAHAIEFIYQFSESANYGFKHLKLTSQNH